jgi:hypothetical protein
MTPLNDWRPLYLISFVSAILLILIIPVQILIYFLSPPPTTPEGFLALYAASPLKGLLSLDLLYILNNVLMIPIYLAFYQSLKIHRPALMTLATVLGLVGLAAYFPSNTAFEMLTLSQRYAAASTPLQQQGLISAAETLLAIYTGTAFNAYYVLNALTLLIVSWVMLKTSVYSRATAFWGLAAGLLMVIPSTAGTLGLVFSILSLIPWIVFSAKVAKAFLKLKE